MANNPIRPNDSRGIPEPRNRAYAMRRDNDTYKSPKISIYDIDYAIMHWIQHIIKPQIEQDGAMIDIPVVYSNGEKWAQVQANGFLRDSSDKQMTPLIMIRRTALSNNDRMANLTVTDNPSANNLLYMHNRSYADVNDLFSKLQNSKKPYEYYVSALPEFVDVEYELIIWTEYMEQMNHVVQDILPTSGLPWGDSWKFITFADETSFETLVGENVDRTVKCTMGLSTRGILMDDFELKESTIQKAYSLKRVVWNDEKSRFSINIDDLPPGGYDNDSRMTREQRGLLEYLIESNIEFNR